MSKIFGRTMVQWVPGSILASDYSLCGFTWLGILLDLLKKTSMGFASLHPVSFGSATDPRFSQETWQTHPHSWDFLCIFVLLSGQNGLESGAQTLQHGSWYVLTQDLIFFPLMNKPIAHFYRFLKAWHAFRSNPWFVNWWEKASLWH